MYIYIYKFVSCISMFYFLYAHICIDTDYCLYVFLIYIYSMGQVFQTLDQVDSRFDLVRNYVQTKKDEQEAIS